MTARDRLMLKTALLVAVVALAVAALGSLASYQASRNQIEKVDVARVEVCLKAEDTRNVLKRIIDLARENARRAPGNTEPEKEALAFYDQILTFLQPHRCD